jgi:hypothetical protein
MPTPRIYRPATPAPPPYVRRFSFTDWSANHPVDPPPGAQLDAEFNAVKATTDQIAARLLQIQNDDGTLGNQTVGRDQIEPEVYTAMTGGFNPRGDWVSGTGYAVADAVTASGIMWAAVKAHTSSGNFSADREAGDWMAIDQPIAAKSIPCDPISAVPANNVQQALEQLAARLAALEAAP